MYILESQEILKDLMLSLTISDVCVGQIRPVIDTLLFAVCARVSPGYSLEDNFKYLNVIFNNQ